MNKRVVMIRRTVVIIAAALSLYGSHGNGDIAVIYGTRVRLRSGPGTSHSPVAMVNAGELVRVTGRSKTRDTLKGKYRFGYYWHEIITGTYRKGWIYGRYCYLKGGKGFFAPGDRKDAIMPAPGMSLHVAVEQSVPVADKNGLTGSEVHGLPYFLSKGTRHARLFWLSGGRIKNFIFREARDMNTWFRLKKNEGVIEKIAGAEVVTVGGEKKLRINIQYASQESKGAYRIICFFEKERLVIESFKITAGPGW